MTEDVDYREVIQGSVVGKEGEALLVEADMEIYYVYEDRIEKETD
ncbi:MAG: hypothetical protein ABEJ56_06740 [Candidatus Nanohaloarchaea archaeon]